MNTIDSQNITIDLNSYKELFDNSKDGIYFSSVEGKILECNQSFLNITGYEKEDFRQLNALDLYTNKEQRLNFQNQILSYGFVKDFEIQLIKKNKELIYCEVSSNAFKDAEGNFIGYKGILRDITRRKKAEFQVQEEKNKRLIDITYIQEKEKKRIARELHDGLGQMLFSTKLKVEKLKKSNLLDAELKKQLQEIENQIKDTIHETRNMARMLRPSVLDDFGVVPALEQLFEMISNGTEVDITFEKPKNVESNKQLDLAIYRIVQETLSNAIKHGKATKINVSLQPLKNEIQLNYSR
jgi:PAS domain S-box-containing protein